MEEEKKFKQISDITEYVKEGIKTGKLPVDEVAKFARIQARQGKVGEEIVTKMANGLEETINVVKLDEKTGNPGWVVTNPDGEQYIIEDSTFQKKYEINDWIKTLKIFSVFILTNERYFIKIIKIQRGEYG